MALLTKVGSFAKINTVATQVVTGVGLQPKAIIFWANSSNLSSGSWKSDMAQMVGFTSGATESYAVNGHSFDSQATSDTYRRMAAKAITMEYGATIAEANLSSFDADGFTLSWTANSATGFLNATNICFMAIGGDSVSAKVVNWNVAHGFSGNKAVAGVGFSPDVVLHLGGNFSSVPGSSPHHGMGFGAMDKAGNQWCNSSFSLDENVGADTSRYQRIDKTWAQITTTAVNAECSYVSMDSGGFTVSFGAVSGAQNVASLCLQGVSAKVGNFSKVNTEFPKGVDSSTAVTATAYSGQRKLARASNGNLLAMHWDGTSTTTTGMKFLYSANDGLSWSDTTSFGFAGTGITHTPNGSLFIDKDDFAHVVYKDRHDGFIYYRRGTPNAGFTAWTWTSAQSVASFAASNVDYPDIVAHKEGTGWKVHIVFSVNDTVTFGDQVRYARFNVTDVGVISQDSGFANPISDQYLNTVHKFPSIDFNHTGDGKTVAGETPHLYAAWSAGTSGAGKGVRFRKATYSAGSWNWSTTGGEKEIDINRYLSDNSNDWMNVLFDGTYAMLAGSFREGANRDVMLYQRDAADGSTGNASYTLIDNVTGAVGMFAGSATYDASGNIYFIGTRGNETPQKLHWRKWNRNTTTFEPAVMIDTDIGGFPRYVSAKRGYSNGRVDFIYTDGSGSPYTVRYGSVNGGVSQQVTAIGFQPSALLLSTHANTAGTTIIPDAKWSFGATDGANQRAIYQFDNDTGTSNAKAYFSNDKVLVVDASEDSTVDTAGSLSSFDTDGFTLSWNPNETVAYQTLYITLGQIPSTFERWGVVHI